MWSDITRSYSKKKCHYIGWTQNCNQYILLNRISKKIKILEASEIIETIAPLNKLLIIPALENENPYLQIKPVAK